MAAAVATLESAAGAAAPPGEATLRLLAGALELGFRVAVDLQRPPDVASDEEMADLVDEILERWNDVVVAAAALAARHESVKAALAAAPWVRDLAAVPATELRQRPGAQEGQKFSPAQRLLQALGHA